MTESARSNVLLFIEVSVLVPILLSYILSTRYRSNRRFVPRGAFALSLPKSQISSFVDFVLRSLIFLSFISFFSQEVFVYTDRTTFIAVEYISPVAKIHKVQKLNIYKQRERGYTGGERGYTT